MGKTMTVGFLVGALVVSAGAPPERPAPAYQLYAVSYGTFQGFPVRGLVAGADSTRALDIEMMVWVLRGAGRIVLVDAGFYRDEFRKAWKIKDYRRPSDAVLALGIKPDQVTDIVVSHAHWDHVDGADLFPQARVWIQREEYEYYRDPAHQANSGVFPSDVAMLEQIQKAGRLALVDGDDREILPGIRVYTGGRHTRASQWVAATVAGGTAVIASDNVYLYENLERHRPIAQTWDSVSNLAQHDRMRQAASPPTLIVPGHDPAVFVQFPTPGNGVARIR